jgi:hypothetical protein
MDSAVLARLARAGAGLAAARPAGGFLATSRSRGCHYLLASSELTTNAQAVQAETVAD